MTAPRRFIDPFILFAMLVAVLALSLPDAARAQPQTKEQRKCIVEMNKYVAKVAKAQGKDICTCIRDGAESKLAPQSIEDCVLANRGDKVGEAADKLRAAVASRCPADPDSPDAPDFGAETPPDPNFYIQAAIDAELSLAHRIFGPDLDEVILPARDPNDATVRASSKCTALERVAT